jgi:hypothetical protein
MSKRIIHELSPEDLIALAQGAKPETVIEKISEASKFIYELNIKHGDAKIPAEVIYHTYKHWKGWDQKRQSKPKFFQDFKKYFEQYRTNSGMSYLLNPKPFDLSDETYWLIRAEIRNEKAKKTKKTQRRSKTSKS